MNQEQRTRLINRVLYNAHRAEQIHGRFGRLFKEPAKSIPFFLKQVIARIRPFKVNYTTLWGDNMSFYLPEGNGLYYYGFYEADLTNFFTRLIQEGDVFFDIGTHVGFYTLLASRLCGPTGSVHGFEPTPRTFASLSENLKQAKGAAQNQSHNQSQTQNIFLNNVAVMDKETEIDFVDYGPKFSAFNTYSARTGDTMKFLKSGTHFKAKTISIDAYCASKHVQPTVVKIDAEGAEHIILEAMTTTLDTARPIVSIEVGGGQEWKHNYDKSIDILLGKGYLCYETTTEGYIKPHTRKETYHYDNLIFVHPSKSDRISGLLLV